MAQPNELNNLRDMDSMTLSYKGDSHEIDADTFIQSLLHFSAIVQEVNKGLNSDRKIEIKINALKEGSFEVLINIISTFTQKLNSLFSKEQVEYATKLIEFVGGIFKLKKTLKNEKPKSVVSTGDLTTITANSGSSVTVNNNVYYMFENNAAIQKSLTREFSALEKDPSVTGFHLIGKDNTPIVQIEKEEFRELGTSSEIIEIPENRIITKTTTLNISKISFDPPMKWDFYYEGTKITALVVDKDFIESLDKGEQFAKGDQLEVEIEIIQEHEKIGDFYKNKSYKVEKIIKHIKPPTQQKLI